MNPERRRTFLRLAGSAAFLGLAGCAGNGGSGGGGDTTQAAAGEDARTTTDGTGAASADTDAGAGTTTAAARTETATAASSDGTTATADTETTNGTSGDGSTTTGATVPSGPVHSAYRTATSRGGTGRNPDSLQPKEAVEYQPQPQDGEQCPAACSTSPTKTGTDSGCAAWWQDTSNPRRGV